MSSHFPLDDRQGTLTMIGIAAGVGWFIVKAIANIIETLEGERRYPWSPRR